MPKKKMAPKKNSAPAARPAPRQRRRSVAAPTEPGTVGEPVPAVRLNLPGGLLRQLAIPERRDFQYEALRWSYALRNRERWNTQSDAVREQQAAMTKLALSLGITEEDLAAIVEAGIVEVDVPWTHEGQDWELRVFPWEFLIATATRERRAGGEQPLTVVRHLRRQAPPAVRTGRPTQWLQVVSAPGKLAQEYDFDSERRLLEFSVQAAQGRFEFVRDPDETSLKREIATRQPHVVHLSGFDSHQGLALLGDGGEGPVRDGFLLRDSETSLKIVEAEPLAALLTSAPGPAPALVACNFYNSAARIAPLAVAAGAGAAIGFQDSFDDDLAELFYTVLYQAWSLADWDIVAAFQYAWQEVRQQQPPLQGSAVVLWSGESIVTNVPVAQEQVEAGQAAISYGWEKRSRQAPALNRRTIRDAIEVDVRPIARLNYSLLHNNGPLFERFRLLKKSAEIGRIEGIQINVELYVGTDSYPFRLEVALDETASLIDLKDQIRVSLASHLSRAIRESIHTSLFVEVTWQRVVLLRRTDRVTLLPVDEWRFDSDNYSWLPSFVLPRDPAVLKVVDAAQRYLMALRDDATAGFDGYQCVAGRAPTPEECATVDLQVRALWSALLYEAPLSYINPPPSFTNSSQRLRTPSDCIEGKRGTCIDLALLLAACLEYVDIYPTVFLLRTHAFPAYWRHDSFHSEFRKARGGPPGPVPAGAPVEVPPPTAGPGQRWAWAFEPFQYREILGEVQAGRLVPLETTLVTGRGSFSDAIVAGVQNLANRREFESMLDILLARTDEKTSVTPLPVRRSDL